MKTTYILILFSFLFGCISCNSKLSYENCSILKWDDFPSLTELQSKIIQLEEPLLRPTRVYNIDSILVFKDDTEETILHKYNNKTLRKKGGCFTFGSGPDEFLWINNLLRQNSDVWVSDLHKRAINRYDIHKFINTDSCNIQASKKAKFEDHFSSIAVLPNGQFIATINNPKHKRLTLYDENGLFMESKGDFPAFQKKFSSFELIEGFCCETVLSPNKNFVYLFYKQTDLIEQYDTQGNLIKRMHGPECFFPEIKENSKNDQIRISAIPGQSRDAYFCPVVTSDKIYVLYSGAYFDPKQPPCLMKHLFVFNNEGLPIQRYILEEPIFNFAIDENTNSLYGISNDPEFHIIQYVLNP